MMTFYCNDCGEKFHPEIVSDSFPDGVGTCPTCIHEAGDCCDYLEFNCKECRKAHKAGHPSWSDGYSRYCQVCREVKTA